MRLLSYTSVSSILSVFVKKQMWSLMGCAVARVQPQQPVVADHADKPEMAELRHVTSGGRSKMVPEREDKSAVNGSAEAGSKNSTELRTQQPPCNSSSLEATCSSAAQVTNQNHYTTDLYFTGITSADAAV